MIYCSQCGSCDHIYVQRIDTTSPTYMQTADHEWAEHSPEENYPLIEFWCESCHHAWDVSGTLEDVIGGKFDEED